MDEVANLLLRIVAEDEGGEKTLTDLRRQLEEFSGTDATATADVDTAQARIELDRLRRDLLKLDVARANPEAHLQGGQIFAEILLLNRLLDAIDNKKVTVDVDVRRDIFDRLQALKGNVDRLGVDIGRNTSGFTSFITLIGVSARAIPILAANLLGVGRAFTHISTLIGGATEGMGALATAAATAGVAAGVIAVLWAALAIVFTTVTAAAGALALALGAAVAQLAALAVAGVAALGPIAVVAITVAASIARIVQALQAQKQAHQQTSQRALQAEQQERAAAQRLEAANQAVADAKLQVAQAAERMQDATVEAFRAMEDAAERARDAVLSVAEAQLGLDRARLNIKRAQQALKDFAAESGTSFEAFKKFTDVDIKFDPKALSQALSGTDTTAQDRLDLQGLILDVRDAKLQEKQATDRLGDSETELTRAHQDNAKFLREGIAAYGPYTAAVQGNASANRSLRRAIQGVSDAREQNALQAQALVASQAKSQVLTGKLTEAEHQLLNVLKQLRRVWKEAFGGATNAILGSLAGAIKGILPLVRSMQPIFTALGKAMGRSITQISKAIGGMGPEFAQLFGASIRLMRPFTQIFIAFLRLFTNIAIAVMPLFVSGITQIAKAFGGWAAGTSNIKVLRAVFKQLAPFLSAFLKIGVGLGKFFINAFIAAAPLIQDFVEWLAKGAQQLAAWSGSKEGQETIKQFFTDVLPLVQEFLKWIGLLIVNLLLIGQAFAPFLLIMFKGWNFIIKLANKFLALLVKLGITGPQVLATIINAIAGIAKKIGGALSFLPGVFSRIWGAIKIDASGHWQNIKAVIMAPINFIKNTVPGIFRTLKGVLVTVWGGIKDAAKFAFEKVRDAIVGPIRGAINLIRDLGEKFFKAGKFIIQKLIDGVTFMAGKAIGAVKKVVDGVTDLLPGSEPKDKSSPLTGLSKRGEALVENFVAGISRRAPRIASELQASLGTIPSSLTVRALGVTPTAAPAVAGGGGGTHIEKQILQLPPPPQGGVPDARYQASQLMRELERRGG